MGPSGDGSLFRTQANTQFNSFQNPLPTMNMGGPGWGVDPSYLTPSYASLYRPGYQEAPITSSRPGFWASANNQLNPFASLGYHPHADPFLAQQQYREQFIPRAGDAAAWAAQNLAVGAGAFWLSGKMLGKLPSALGRGGMQFGSGMAQGMMGAGFAGTALGRGIGAVAGGAFGVAGYGLGLGAMAWAGQRIIDAADGALFDPYANSRTTGRNLRENFSGITFGGGEYGHPTTGRGLSFGASTRISNEVTRSGLSNWSMSGKEISGIADLASKSGLLENVNPEKFAKQITAITKQVALIAAVANDPDYRNSIEIMAKLKDAGLVATQSGSFMSKLGGNASVAGVSLKRMMDMGVQGQFLFGANNITPYLGMSQYSSNYASFASAHRNGLISPELLARMGGVGGATQSALTGMVNAAQTPFNSILMANQYLSGMGRTSGNISSDLSRFGGRFAGNPMGMAGAMGLHSGAMMSAQMSDRGILGVQDQILSMAKMTGQLNQNGTLDDDKAYLMAKNMGLDHSQAEAIVVQLRNARNPNQLNNEIAGLRSSYATQRATIMNKTGASGFLPYAKVTSALKNIGSSIAEGVYKGTERLNTLSGFASDFMTSYVDQLNFGNISGVQGGRGDIGKLGSYGTKEYNWGDIDLFSRNNGPGLMTVLGQKTTDIAKTLGLSRSPDMNAQESMDRYLGDLKKAGISEDEFMRAYIERKNGNTDTELSRKIQKVLGTRSISAFDEQMGGLHSQLKKSGLGTLGALMREKGYSDFQNALVNQKGSVDLIGLAGDFGVDITGNKTAIDLIREQQGALTSGINEKIKLHNESKITAGQFSTDLAMYTAMTNKNAAELQIEAAHLQLKAAGKEDTPKASASPASSRTASGAINKGNMRTAGS